jgi:hypothetical protein
MAEWVVNGEMESALKEVVTAYLRHCPPSLPGGTEENQKSRRFKWSDSTCAPPEHKSEAPPLPICTVILVVIQTVVFWANTVQSGRWVSYLSWNIPAIVTTLVTSILKRAAVNVSPQVPEHGITTKNTEWIFRAVIFCCTSSCLFNDAVSTLDYIGRIVHDEWILNLNAWKNGCGLIWDTIPATVEAEENQR